MRFGQEHFTICGPFNLHIQCTSECSQIFALKHLFVITLSQNALNIYYTVVYNDDDDVINIDGGYYKIVNSTLTK